MYKYCAYCSSCVPTTRAPRQWTLQFMWNIRFRRTVLGSDEGSDHKVGWAQLHKHVCQLCKRQERIVNLTEFYYESHNAFISHLI